MGRAHLLSRPRSRRGGCASRRWHGGGELGIGSAAPVLVFALALAASREAASRAYQKIQSAQRWIAPASGWLLILVGVWMCLHLTLRLF
jgi:threonine/homoserine/homoserine lactone efflux protein